MATSGGSLRRVLRENAFLVAAVALPLVVVGLFLVASAIPRWRVPPPAYDLLLRGDQPYQPARGGIAVEFRVRDGHLEATVRGLAATAVAPAPRLLLVDHETLNVRDIPLDLPSDFAEGDPPVTVPIAALAGRRVLADSRAPDGYEMRVDRHGSRGLIGGLFGVGGGGSYGTVAIANRGRVIRIALPSGSYAYSVTALGWVMAEGTN